MTNVFTIKIENESGEVIREMTASLAKEASAMLKIEIMNGAFYGEVINNHYNVVQFKANRSTYAVFS